ncbi:hypothetical protein [Paenibacillus qinlingensis]|uniref:hypothetical protein n=1 Tax=Paenibacillus qinlingensis TaxID=1837343 RepID=UPI0015676D3E|nr:hypothetical protein [Paenibacillus qinlingensis]NQX57798.1 hypothetical protein [Paenibacillus qinlingensis]
MSKNRVWNKGKRNGGGGPAPGTSYKEKLAAEQPFQAEVIDLSNPINQVKRMSRENWVERPTRPARAQQPNK